MSVRKLENFEFDEIVEYNDLHSDFFVRTKQRNICLVSKDSKRFYVTDDTFHSLFQNSDIENFIEEKKPIAFQFDISSLLIEWMIKHYFFKVEKLEDYIELLLFLESINFKNINKIAFNFINKGKSFKQLLIADKYFRKENIWYDIIKNYSKNNYNYSEEFSQLSKEALAEIAKCLHTI